MRNADGDNAGEKLAMSPSKNNLPSFPINFPYPQGIVPRRLLGINFFVMHGNGNIILVVDLDLSNIAPSELTGQIAKELCEAFTSFRVDGVAFVDQKKGTCRMIFFDRDGTRESMCGNGLRCVTRYYYDKGIINGEGYIETDDGRKWVLATTSRVSVAVGTGREFQLLNEGAFVFTGVAHLVVFTDDVDSVNVWQEGARLRYDPKICHQVGHPEGVHVDFLTLRDGFIDERTYEVGVEGETLSCGTGVAAAAYVTHRLNGWQYPITVRTRGGIMTVEENFYGLVISGEVGYLRAMK